MNGATYGVKVAITDGSAGTACPDSKKAIYTATHGRTLWDG